MNAHFALILPIALLAACEKGEPTRVTINTNGNGAASTDKGKVEIGTGGFKADIQIPGMAAMGDRMKIDGVRLYPQSTVSGVNIDAGEGDNDRFAMQFTAPADRAKVSEWFAGQFKDSKFEARTTPTGYAGTTADGDWFTLDLTDAGGGKTRGEFKFGKQQR